MMAHAALLVGYDRIEIDILHAFKDIALYEWILLFQLTDQFLDFYALGLVFFVIAGGAGVGELAGTLDEMQVVVISPRLDIILAYQIQRDGSAPFLRNWCCGALAS